MRAGVGESGGGGRIGVRVVGWVPCDWPGMICHC